MRKTHMPKSEKGALVTTPACGRGRDPSTVTKTVKGFDNWPTPWKCEYCQRLREKQS